MQNIKIDKGEVRDLPIVAADTVGILMKKGDKQGGYLKEIQLSEMKAPIQKGQVVGAILIKGPAGQEVARVDLVAAKEVKEASMWQLFKRTVQEWMTFGE